MKVHRNSLRKSSGNPPKRKKNSKKEWQRRINNKN